jgi:putative ABC transport system permease protein
VRSVGRAAHRLPLAGRLAVRDLARFPSRSGMALGAISLAVGIPIAVVITSAAARATADAGNLSPNDLLLRIGDAEGDMVADAGDAEVERMAAQVNRLADMLGEEGVGDAAVVPLAMAMERGSERIPGFDVRPAVALGVPVGDDTLQDVVAYVATPAVVEALALDPLSLDGVDVLTVRREPLRFLTTARRSAPEPVTHRAALDVVPYSSGPTTLITPAAARRYGWDTVPVGWMVHAPAPLTGEQVRAAREAAAEAGLTVEARRATSTTSLRMGAIGAGAALALAVVAMTVGLVRAEAAGDLRTLAALGAPGRVRRRLTAWTAGALGLLGVVLGASGAYLALASGYARELGVLGHVPVAELAILAAGVPLLAAGAGWALGGHEPSLVRPDR